MVANERAIRRVIIAGVLLAITLILVFTQIGMIPVPTPAGHATIAHIPAIIGGVLEGPLVGLLVGLGFGFASFANATIPLFKDPLVAIVPRVFIGLAASYAYIAMRRAKKPSLTAAIAVLLVLTLAASYLIGKTTLWLGILWAAVAVGAGVFMLLWIRREDVQVVALGLAGAIGSLTNTVLVLGAGVWRGYLPGEAAWAIAFTQGVPEAIVAGLVTVAVVTALRQIGRRGRSKLSRGQ